MSRDILNKPIVLSLNRVWQPIGHRTVEQAIVALTGGRDGTAPAVGMDIVYARHEDGSWNFDKPEYVNPVGWDEWITLPIRDFDMVLHSARLAIRVPTVIIAVNFDRMPMRKPRLSRDAIFHRDGGVCQYTGEQVGRHGGNLDHVVPRHLGGRDSFENLVWSKREVNTRKANRMAHDVGLKLLRKPTAPKPVPVITTIRDARHRDWTHFLVK